MGKYHQKVSLAQTFHVSLSVQAFGFNSWTPLTGVRVSACNKESIDCGPADILAEAVSSNGQASLSWPVHQDVGFTGWFKFTDERTSAATPDAGLGATLLPPSEWVSTLPFLDGPVYVIGLPPLSIFDWGATFDAGFKPDRVQGYVELLDCNGFGARGLQLRVGHQEPPVVTYWSKGAPTVGATESVDGGVSFASLRAGPVSLTAADSTGGRTMARAALVLRAGTYVRVDLFPLDDTQAAEQAD